jgi:hypothetical protein
MRLVALGLAIALAGCNKDVDWKTRSGEADLILAREYTGPGDKAPSWVVRLDLNPANPMSWSQHWNDDSLTFQIRTTRGTFGGGMTCHAEAATFSCDGRAFDAAKGRVVTYVLDAKGHIGSPKQSDLASYKSFH